MLNIFSGKYRSHIKIFIYSFVLLSSCGPSRNLVYFSDIQDDAVYNETIVNDSAVTIQPNDLLSILVTSLSPEANNLFNRGALPNMGTGSSPSTSPNASYAQGNAFNESYLVDYNGLVDFPVLGKIKLGGLTREAAKEMLTTRLKQYLKEPIVYIRHLNFRITVIGEVKNPASFSIPSERVNLLQALGLAGDMTPYGKRENVLVIREEQGTRTIARVNLNSKEVMKSPYFYLQQNDVVYVEPHKVLERRTSNSDRDARFVQISISAISLIIVIITQLSNR